MGRNLLMECFIEGYYRPRVLEHEAIKKYVEMYYDRFSDDSLVCLVDDKPAMCTKCGSTDLKEVIYGEPSELRFICLSMVSRCMSSGTICTCLRPFARTSERRMRR